MLNYKLGKAPAKFDKRTLKMKAIFKQLPSVPAEWDFDTGKSIPLPMFANDQYGDCVIAGRAHQTLRFEKIEQESVISIKDEDVVNEYWKETGGQDNGLVVLDSLTAWRNDGWNIGEKKYNIHAFAQVNQKDPTEVKVGIFELCGLGSGFSLPQTAADQIEKKQIWDVVSCWGKGSRGSWGGHYVYISGYNSVGPVCVTWGQKQQMTWKFMARYCDELYGIVDDKDKFLASSTIDVEAIEQFLNSIRC